MAEIARPVLVSNTRNTTKSPWLPLASATSASLLLIIQPNIYGLAAAGAAIWITASKSPVVNLVTLLGIGILTDARTVSAFSIAGLPIAALAAVAIAIVLAPRLIEVRAKLRGVTTVYFAAASLLMTITVLRLIVDVSTYKELALRDAIFVPMLASGAVFGVLSAIAGPIHQLRRFRTVLLIGLLYNSLFLVRAQLPFLDFSNIGLVGVAGVAYAVFRPRLRLYELACLLLGATCIIASQGRMIYICTVFLLLSAMFAKSARNGSSKSTRILRLLVILPIIAAFVFSGLTAAGLTQGRLQAISPDAILSQLTGLATNADSGSVADRQRWWRGIEARMDSHPQTYVVGLGLGPDLLNGYKAPDGSLVRKPHNDLIETGARLGVAAAACLAVMLFLPLVRRRGSVSAGAESATAYFTLLAATMTALAQPYLAYPHGALVAGFAAGYILLQSRSKE